MFCLHNILGYVVSFLFACLNFLIKLRCEFITLYSFIYCSNGFRSHIKYLDYLVNHNSNIEITMGNPGVFPGNPYPYLSKPTPMTMGRGFKNEYKYA